LGSAIPDLDLHAVQPIDVHTSGGARASSALGSNSDGGGGHICAPSPAPPPGECIAVLLCSALTWSFDLTLLALTGLGLRVHGDKGAVALLLVLCVSALCQGYYSVLALRMRRLDAAFFHSSAQFLLLQHSLTTSTAFLCNLLLLVLSSVHTDLSAALGQLGPGERALAALSTLAYAGILVSTVVLVALHVRAEEGAAETLAAAAAASSGIGGGSGGGMGSSGSGSDGTTVGSAAMAVLPPSYARMAVPVPLDGAFSPGPPAREGSFAAAFSTFLSMDPATVWHHPQPPQPYQPYQPAYQSYPHPATVVRVGSGSSADYSPLSSPPGGAMPVPLV
jgi:hypothetical protein